MSKVFEAWEPSWAKRPPTVPIAQETKWTMDVGTIPNVARVSIADLIIVVELDDGTVRRVQVHGTDPTIPEFKLQLLGDADIVPGRGWEIKDGCLVSPVLGRPPQPHIPRPDTDIAKEFYGDLGVQRGPDGFIFFYGAPVLCCAVAWAFAPFTIKEIPDDDAKYSVIRYETRISPKRRYPEGPCEDGITVLEDKHWTFACVIDGHSGHSTMDIIKEHAANEFKNALHLGMENRANSIRSALMDMSTKLKKRCDEAFTSNRTAERFIEEIKDGKERKKLPKFADDSGACMAAVVIDSWTSTLHACIVGDCWVGLAKEDGSIERLPVHEAYSPAEIARVMLMGGYVSPPGDTHRILGNLMPGRAFGDCGMNVLRPNVISAEPTILSKSIRQIPFVVVASDGLEPYTMKIKEYLISERADRAFDLLRSCNYDDRALVLITNVSCV